VTIEVEYTMLSLNSPDPGVVCDDLPETGCIAADANSSILMSDRTAVDPTKKGFFWKLKDSQTSVSDFFDPSLDTNYVVCIYDTTAGVYSLAIDKGTYPSGGIAVPAWADPEGTDCVVKRRTGELGDCWTEVQRGSNPPTGYKYKDRRPRADWGDLTNGLRTIWLRAGRRSNLFGGAIFFRAKGPSLPALSTATVAGQLLDQQNEVLVQLVNSEGSCWEASYTWPPQTNGAFHGGLLFRDRME
jgi:hypothetical protein